MEPQAQSRPSRSTLCRLIALTLLSIAACTQGETVVGPSLGSSEANVPAAALAPGPGQVAYVYVGNPFDRITGPTYSTSDFVTATLVLEDPLPPNLSLADIRGFAGFSFEISDGHQTLTGVTEALVSTDASGQIIAPWSFIRNCCLFPNNGVSTVVWPGQRGVFDWGILSAPSGDFPDTPFDAGQNFDNPGTWTMVTGSFACTAVTEIPHLECEALVALYNATDGDNWTTNTGWLANNTPCTWHGVFCFPGSVSTLLLSDNGLNGSIPAELGALTGLRQLHLSVNRLSGPIPNTLGNLPNLFTFNLLANQLTGAIPATLGNLSGLISFSVGGNQLSGPIPPELGDLSNLQFLDLGSNQLIGPIPAQLGRLTQLQILRLSHNALTGTIPPDIGQLSALFTIELHDNQLTGAIPSALGGLPNLRALQLQTNQLTGLVPLPVATVGVAASFCDLRFNASLYMPATSDYQALSDPICGIPLTPLASLTSEVTTQIAELVNTGQLGAGLGNALTKRFEKALEKLNQGNTAAATDMLTGLISQITNLINSGQISAAEGENLIALASALLP